MEVNMLEAMKLIEKYSKCPDCGNEHIGGGEGTLEITKETFIRTCKCGWKVGFKDSDPTESAE